MLSRKRSWGKKRIQRAVSAKGSGFAAEVFAGVNQEGVEFVEQLVVGGQVLLEEGAKLVVGMFGRGELVTFENAAGVGIDNEGGMTPSIEEDGVGGFRADAMDGEELLPEFFRGCAEHAGEGAAIVFLNEADKRLEFAGLLPEIAGGTDEAREARRRNGEDSGEGEEFFAAKIGDGALDIGPGSILGEDGADDDLEARTAGPPMLWPMYGE